MISERIKTAAQSGYYDAKRALELYETHGLSLTDTATRCRQAGLKMDWSGLLHELQSIGKSRDGAISLLQEASEYALNPIAPRAFA